MPVSKETEMGQDKEATHRRLTELRNDNSVQQLPINGRKYAVFSDLHLGDGGKADDLRRNEKALIRSVRHYYQAGYTLILLGDIEEFWQFDLKDVVARYDESVYKEMRKFTPGRFIRVFGNHDSEWAARKDPATGERSDGSPEALKMVDSNGKVRVMLVHGHQGSTESDKNSWASRFFVRVYKIVEPIIKLDKHPSATKSQIAKDYERIFHQWAETKKVVIICGHSHRAIFASMSYADRLQLEVLDLQKRLQELAGKGNKKEIKRLLKILDKKWFKLREEEAKGRRVTPLTTQPSPKGWYYNSGCGLYTDGITCLEVDDGSIRLVKWHRNPKAGRDMLVLQPEGGKVQMLVP
jgi:UDP-2,3-diacylglucosamine pyrophosphatase LpxH